MARQIGGIIALSLTTAYVTRSADPADAFAQSFVVLGGTMAATTLLVLRVPNHRGRLHL
jgi:hypothetical protein